MNRTTAKHNRAANQMDNNVDASQKLLAKNDALAFLKAVEVAFHNKSENYSDFLLLMVAYKAKTIDAIDVISRIKELFKGHIDLILGFSKFLPKGYQIIIDDDDDDGVETKEEEKDMQVDQNDECEVKI